MKYLVEVRYVMQFPYLFMTEMDEKTDNIHNISTKIEGREIV